MAPYICCSPTRAAPTFQADPFDLAHADRLHDLVADEVVRVSVDLPELVRLDLEIHVPAGQTDLALLARPIVTEIIVSGTCEEVEQ